MKTPNYVAAHAYTARNYASYLILNGSYFVFSQYAYRKARDSCAHSCPQTERQEIAVLILAPK